MAASPVELFTGDGVEDEYTYVFEVPGNYSAVLVKTRPTTSENFSTLSLNVEYSHNASTKLITFLAGFIPATGTIIRIERFTNRDRQVDYVGGSTIEERNLDNDPNRLTMVTQEIEAGLLDALRRNDERDAWNGESLPSENCGDATAADGWVTLQQLEQAVGSGGLPTSSTEGLVFTFTGNGDKTQFELNDVEGIHKELVNVFIESVYQSADGTVYDILRKTSTGYPTAGDDDDYLEFVTAPPAGAKIEVRTLKGSFFTEVPDFSITTGKLADDAVNLDKINLGSGAAGRFMVLDALGNPSVRVIGAEDMKAAAADENASLPADFSLILRSLRLDQFAAPDNPVDFNGKRLIDIGAATDPQDAMSKSLVEEHVSEQLAALAGISLQTASGSFDLTEWFLAFLDNFPGFDITIQLPFKPNFVMIQAVKQFPGLGVSTQEDFQFLFVDPITDGSFIGSTTMSCKVETGQNRFTIKSGWTPAFQNFGLFLPDAPASATWLALKF